MSSERALILRHAGTVLVGQLAAMAFGIADTVIAGRYDDTALAALSVASATYVTVNISLMGILQALLPVWAELHGSGNNAAVGRSVRQALYLCLLVAMMGMWALLSPGPLLAWTRVPAVMLQEVRDYLSVVALSLPAALLFRMYGTLNQALGKPKLVTVVQVLALLVKVPLSWVLVLGVDGWIEPMGLVGCAWATLCIHYLMLALALWLLRTRHFYAPYRLWQRIEAPHWATQRNFLRLGVPSGLTIGVDVTSFTLMSLFIARLGVVASASHQIVANMTALLYMVPLSLSIASSARISYWKGSGDARQARLAARTGLQLVMMTALTLVAALWLSRHAIASWYTQSAAVSALAATLLAWLCLYHLADALQVFCVFALRCYRITVLPLLSYTVLLWGVGLGGGYALAYRLDLPVGSIWASHSPVAFWQASTLALLLTASVLLPVLWRAAHRRDGRAK